MSGFNITAHLWVVPMVLLLGWTLIYVPPSSPTRLFLFPVILATAAAVSIHAHKCSSNLAWNTFIGASIGTTTMFDAVDLLFVKRMYFDPDTKVAKGGYRATDAAKWALFQVFSKRKIGSPYQAKNTPPFDSTNPSYVPSRRTFLLRSVALFLVIYVFMDFITNQPLDDADAQVAFSPEKERVMPRLLAGHISPRDLAELVGITAGHWLAACVSQSLPYLLFAIVGVGLGVHEPKDWPPRYGSLSESYSVRRFWGVFWHQDLRVTLSSLSSAFVHRVLRLPPGLVSRYLKIAGVFLLSGLIHVHVDLEMGGSLHESRSLRFFLLQVVGIMLEDAAQAGYRGLTRGNRAPSEPKLWQKVAGFVWLVAFLTLTTPSWTFHTFRRQVPFPLPISFFKA